MRNYKLILGGLKCHQVAIVLFVSTEQEIMTQELQLADHGNSTSLLLQEEREKMGEEKESLRTKQDAQLIAKRDMNGTKLMTDVALATQHNGKLNVATGWYIM